MLARPQFVIILIGTVVVMTWTYRAQRKAQQAASIMEPDVMPDEGAPDIAAKMNSER
jgi:hypothetical protein